MVMFGTSYENDLYEALERAKDDANISYYELMVKVLNIVAVFFEGQEDIDFADREEEEIS